MEFNFKEFWPNFVFYLNSLLNYEFSFYNPLFWVAILSLLWILLLKWDTKKAFHFCLVLALILLGTTEIGARYAIRNPGPGQYFDVSIIKLISGFVVAILTMLYCFLL